MKKINVFRVGEIWKYRFQANGKRICRTTGTTSKTEAEIIAQQAYAEALRLAQGEAASITLRAAVNLWLEANRPTASAHHIRNMENLSRMHWREMENIPLCDFTAEIVERARNHYLETHARSSANHWLICLRAVFSFARRRKHIADIPWHVPKLKVQRKPRVILPATRVSEWFEAIDQQERPWVSLAVRMMIGLGLRESEALSARWEWLDWERQQYTPGITKGREADALYIVPWLFDWLRTRAKAEGLMVTSPDGKGCQPGFARHTMRVANAACDLPNITPHRLRGTLATLLSEAGAPVQDIQRALRHKSPLTTIGYLEVDMQRITDAQQAIANLIIK